MLIGTDRLELIPFTPDAIDLLLARDQRRLREITGLEFPEPLRPPPLMEELLPEVRDRLRAAPTTLGWWTWLAVERDSRRVTGALGFGGPPDPEGAVMIGYSTYQGADRKGYASEATRALVEWALAQPGVTRVCASIPPDNWPARRVAEKVGMEIFATVWEEDSDEVLLYRIERQ